MRMKRQKQRVQRIKTPKDEKKSPPERETLQHALTACITDPVIILNLDGTAVHMNASFEETFGWTSGEIREHIRPYIPEGDTRTMKHVREALRGKAFRIDATALTKDERAIDVVVSGHRFSDGEDEPVGLVITLRDVTALRRLQHALPLSGRELEEFMTEHDDDLAGLDDELVQRIVKRIDRDRELARAEENCRRIFEGRSLGLAVFDRKGRCLAANKQFRQMLGYAGDEGPSKEDIFSLIPPAWQSRSKSDWQKVSGHAIFRGHEIERDHGNGKRLSLLASGGILEKKADSNHLMFVSLVDITARDKLLEKMRAKNQKLSSRVTALGERTKELTHDLDMSKEELARLRKNLRRVNDAMKILILDFQEQKKELETRIVNNFRLTVEPLIEQFRSLNLPKSQRYLLETLDFSIRHITSYFGINVGRKGGRLTPREIEICQMIRQGKDSREIALAMGLSYQTIIVHRKNIRKKLGIKKTKQNLASFIQESM